jgi:general secretion pathway protein B
MSYILDALRKADAERDRDAVPDLNAQPLAAQTPPLDLPAPARSPFGWLAAGVALALAAVLAWQWMKAEPAPVVAQPPPAPPAAPTPVTRTAPAPAPVPQTAAASPPRPATKPPAAAAPPPLPARIPGLAELPETQRRSLPPLNVGGIVQSPVPAARMLIVDGQVLREGDEAAPGLKLEKIQPGGAIFNQRGQRFELPLP